MATIENRGGSFRIAFRYGGKRFRRSLLTDDDRAARAALARVEDNLRRVGLGLLEIPDDADIAAFLISDGRMAEKPRPKSSLSLRDLFDTYFASLPEGNLEPSTLATMRQHVNQLYDHFGHAFPIRTLSLTLLQEYVEKRAGHKNQHGKPITPATIKKAVVTLRTVWNWGTQHKLLSSPFPNKGLKYPKSKEKPPFQTFAEVSAIASRLLPENAAEYWECAFLMRISCTGLLADAFAMLNFSCSKKDMKRESRRHKAEDSDDRLLGRGRPNARPLFFFLFTPTLGAKPQVIRR